MFLVPNIDQMYKEMKKIVEVGNKGWLNELGHTFCYFRIREHLFETLCKGICTLGQKN
jgi:hypothetical protein